MRLIQDEKAIRLEFRGRTVFEHSKSTPFATAADRKASYKSSFGNFKVKLRDTARIPLTECEVVSNTDDSIALKFSGGVRWLTVAFSVTDNRLYFSFTPSGEFGVSLTFSADADEGVFGGGEQFRQLNMKGEVIVNFVSEHIVVPPIAQKLILKRLYREKAHSAIATYAPMTTYVSSNRYAIRFTADAYADADFRTKDKWMFDFLECPENGVYATENSYKALGMSLNRDTENRENLPDWCFDGMIVAVQGGFDRVIEKAELLHHAGAKICGVWSQDWSGKKVTAVGRQVYWNWEACTTDYPNFEENVAKLKAMGIHFLAYINPYLVKDSNLYTYCKEKGYLIKNSLDEVYHVKSTTFDAGMLDLTNPEACDYIKEVIIKKNMLDRGVDGYMADFGEYLPVDCVLHKGLAADLHNKWPAMWAKLNREAVESHPRRDDIFFFTRSGSNDCQKYTTMMWTGDQHTDFTKDYGMPSVIPATFNLGFSGVTAAHSDVGGFTSFMSMARDKEIFVRWMEMNTFSPLMRSHETIRPDFNTQPYDGDITPYTVSLSAVHAALKDYLTACMHEANNGIPVMRPDFYESNDFENHREPYCYLLGSDIFVCPVIEKGATVRRATLPPGTWVRFLKGGEYEGGRAYDFDAPLGCPVALFRKDSPYATEFGKISL